MPVPFEKLYPKQKAVVKHKANRLLVLAGPGTGKTEVLTHRIAHLVQKYEVYPKDILGITFSRKVAREMADRIKGFDGFDEAQPRITTIHAEALYLLKKITGEKLFLVDDDETSWLFGEAARDIGLYLERKELKAFERKIALFKANNILPKEIPCPDEKTNRLINLYSRYEELLHFNQAVDLDGLVMKTIRILEASGFVPEIGNLCVDEYQDINESEFSLIKILATKSKSFLVVGDDDQSIYGWRGADPNIIRRFAKDFPDSEIEKLEESHRCSGHILHGAQAIVAKDPEYQHKPLRSVRGEGIPIHILVSRSGTREALWIADWIKKQVLSGVYEANKIAILCKTLKLADFLAEQLRISKIDYVYWRSGNLFTRKITKDVLSHVRLLIDKEDNLALMRCIQTETGKGLGEGALFKIRRIAEKHSCSFWQVMIDQEGYPDLKRWSEAINHFKEIINYLENKSLKLEVPDTLKEIAKQIRVLKNRDFENLITFANSLKPEIDLKAFLDEINRNRGIDLAKGAPEPEEEKAAVTIMSMHAAKGLTFDVVFILGIDEDIFPNPAQDLNEQRRLCYVAMTRARKELFLCCARMRTGPPARGWRYFEPSRFLHEIPKENREIIRV